MSNATSPRVRSIGLGVFKLLPTIISRCQEVHFYGLPADQCSSVIQRLQPETTAEEALLLAELSGGSPGTALALQEKDLVELYRSLIHQLEDTTPDSSDALSGLLEMAAELATLKDDLGLMLGLLRIWLRDQMKTERHGGLEMSRRRLEALERAQDQLSRNCNRNLVCEVLLFNLQSPAAAVS